MYEFDRLPLDPIAPGTNVLVAGPAMGGTHDCFLRMAAPARDVDEAAVVVATSNGADGLLADLESAAGVVDRWRVGFVDCVGGGGLGPGSGPVRTVSSPRDLTGIGMELSDLYEAFYERDVDRIRTGLDSVSTLLMYADLETVFRFLHVLIGRIASTDGLGTFVVDPTSRDEQTIQTIAQLFDARVDVRDGEDATEIRIRGLADQPDGWLELSADGRQ